MESGLNFSPNGVFYPDGIPDRQAHGEVSRLKIAETVLIF